MLGAPHVLPERVARLPRGQERESGLATLGREELQVEEARKVVDQPGARSDMALELSPIVNWDLEMRYENEHGKTGYGDSVGAELCNLLAVI